MNLYNAVAKNVSESPEREALRYFGHAVSYGTFGKTIEQTASALRQLGISAGDIVTLSLPSTPECLATIYALNKIGAVVSTIDLRATAAQVVEIVNGLNAKMLFITDFNLEAVAPEAEQMSVEHIVVLRGCEMFPSVVSAWYALGEVFNGRRRAFRSSHKFMHWSGLLAHAVGETPCYDWPLDSAQMIFQTSGTTGHTKSVMLSAENISLSVQTTLNALNDAAPTDSILCLIPPFAFHGFATTVHLPLSVGMTVDIVPIWEPGDFVKTVAEHRPQHVFTVPSLWDTIFDEANQHVDLSSLKTVAVAGDVLSPEFERSINEFLRHSGCRCYLSKAYGMTETAGLVAHTPQETRHRYEVGFSGMVTGGHKVRIVDGEVCVAHSTKLLGYYNNEEATRELLRPDADGTLWLHTGDSGYLDDEGNLYITGRMKRMLVRYDGTKIFPVEIEEALMRHPEVRSCAVVGIRDERHPQSSLPVAFCVVKNKDEKTREEIMRFAENELQNHLHPAQLFFLDEIPVATGGKVDYSCLVEIANKKEKKQYIMPKINIIRPPKVNMSTKKDFWKQLGMLILGTTISLILTITAATLMEMHQRAKDRQLSAMMVLSNIELFARYMEMHEDYLASLDSVATWLLSKPVEELDLLPEEELAGLIDQATEFIFVYHDKSAESIFSKNIDTWKNMGNVRFIDNVGSCFAMMNQAEEYWNNWMSDVSNIKIEIKSHPGDYEGSTIPAKLIRSNQVRSKMQGIHAFRAWFLNVAATMRYQNRRNMLAIGIDEQDVMEYTDAREVELNLEEEPPDASMFVVPSICPDSVTSMSEIDAQLDSLKGR